MSALSKHLKQTGERQKDFAERGGWREATVSAWCTGAVPSLENALKIEALTEGSVLVSSWYSKSAPSDIAEAS